MITYKRHRFPPEIICPAVWLYHRFSLSHRDIEDLLSERGIAVRWLTYFCRLVGTAMRPSDSSSA